MLRVDSDDELVNNGFAVHCVTLSGIFAYDLVVQNVKRLFAQVYGSVSMCEGAAPSPGLLSVLKQLRW